MLSSGSNDSHSDADRPAASPEQTNKRKNPDAEDSKHGKVAVRKKKSFKRFRHDLEQVVIRGKCTSGLQYILETDHKNLYASYLLSVFGDFAGAHGTVSHKMADNPEVMDLWEQYSGEETAEEALRMTYEEF